MFYPTVIATGDRTQVTGYTNIVLGGLEGGDDGGCGLEGGDDGGCELEGGDDDGCEGDDDNDGGGHGFVVRHRNGGKNDRAGGRLSLRKCLHKLRLKGKNLIVQHCVRLCRREPCLTGEGPVFRRQTFLNVA